MRACKAAAVLGAWAVTVAPVSAYYHYVQYLSRTGPYTAALAKFDLAALPSKTLTFVVADAGPNTFSQNDSFSSVLSQVRQALATWNAVESSDLRIAFGGLAAPGVAGASVAGAQVIFDELPPGLLGLGGITRQNTTVTTASGTFVPILRSEVRLTNDVRRRPGPSYREAFFQTAVHDIGHALGLQHTFTSSAMATSVTRATSLTQPIGADDIAGLSVLYPAASFGVETGSIVGRVLMNGAGVHLASVVAIRSGAGAVSALTNPDGTYRIDGVPPGQYFVYAHPLPPQSDPAYPDITFPYDPSGNPVAPSRAFNTLFYGGTIDYTSAQQVTVLAGATADGVAFNVSPRADVPVYGVSVYSFFNGNVVSPGYLNMVSTGYGGVLAGGVGLAANGALAPALTVQIMGGAANVAKVQPYLDPNGFTYLNLGVSYSLGATSGPQHLLFTQNGFLYVLPSGLNLVQKAPPSVSSVNANADGSVAVTGTSFAPDSSIYFDGLPTAIRSLDDASGKAVVIPPPGTSGQRATVSVYNHDGQNSLFLQAAAPLVYAYATTDAPSISISPNALPAGSEAVVLISGANTRFTAGQTVAGFGTSDIFVRNVFVLSATQMLVNVSIAPQAVLGTTEVSTVAGFQMASLPGGFATLPAAAGPIVIPQLVNAIPGQTGAYAGAVVTVRGSSLVAGNRTPSVTVNGDAAAVLSATANQLTLQLPAGLAPGPALLRVSTGQDISLPVAISIDTPPAVITGAVSASNGSLDSLRPAHGGEVIRLRLSGFADPATVIFPNQVKIVVGGISHTAILVVPVDSGLFEVSFVLSNLVRTAAQAPVTVYLDARSSLPATLAVLN